MSNHTNTKNILILANDKRTYFYHEVVENVRKAGHSINWACFSKVTREWLIGQGENPSAVLDITEYGYEWVGDNNDQELSKYIEWFDQVSGTAVRNIIMRDRKLCYKDNKTALKYIAIVIKYTKRFLEEQGIDAVIGEQSWAFETTVGHLCKAMNIYLVNPASVRVPPGRFALFKDENKCEIFRLEKGNTKDQDEAKRFLRSYEKEKTKPEYFSPDISIGPTSLSDLPSPFGVLRDKYNETRFQYRDILNYRPRSVVKALNGLKHYIEWPFDWQEPPKEQKYIFITLHRSPEASLDVVGDYYSDQIGTIKTLCRSIPAEYSVLVKEHSSAIGEREGSFYEEITSIPKLDLVSPTASSFDFIENASFVYSIAGTASYEAALMGVPSATAVPMFFSPIMSRDKIDPYQTDLRSMKKLLANMGDIKTDRSDIVDFMSWLFSNSYKGIISNPMVDPRCMASDNIESVSEALLCFLEKN